MPTPAPVGQDGGAPGPGRALPAGLESAATVVGGRPESAGGLSSSSRQATTAHEPGDDERTRDRPRSSGRHVGPFRCRPVEILRDIVFTGRLAGLSCGSTAIFLVGRFPWVGVCRARADLHLITRRHHGASLIHATEWNVPLPSSVVPHRGATVAKFGMTSCPCLSNDPGVVSPNLVTSMNRR